MLTKVRFKNFKSFTGETIISLEKSKYTILEESNTYNQILKGCCFYGSNASGKTNALNAITLLLDLLLKDSALPIDSLFTIFNKEKNMFFEYTFKINESEIIYYFEFDRSKRITSEKLTYNGKLMLDRLINSAKSYLTDNVDYDKDSVDEYTLFLKKIYFNTKFMGFPDLRDWIDFLKNSIYLNPIREVGKIVYFDPAKVKEIDLINYLDKNGVEEINKFFMEFKFPYKIKYDKKDLNPFISPLSRIVFVRESLPDVPFFMESYGNSILLSILPSFLTIIKSGGIFAIDEFSSGLHNELEELLIKYFFKYSKNSQLFFVSHSTNLLKTSLLRPDQIYSVDLTYKGSQIKKFSDERPRESQNLEKMYLSGTFGGIPLYGQTE